VHVGVSRAGHDRNLQGAAPLRILVAEDSPVVALAIEEMLQVFGMLPVGPFGNIAAALDAAENEQVDAAILDLNIRGTKAFSLFSALDRRQIPFIIASGYADWTMPEEWRDRTRLAKPFDEPQLRAKLEEVLRGRQIR
jgi:CheY-like chemotaxis protein